MIREPHQETLKVHKNPNLTFSLCVFSLIIFSELSSGPHLPVRACSRTPPPGGDSTPPPGVGYGDGASERQSASGRAGFGEQGEGTSTEGQRPRRTGILNLPVNVFCVITDIVFFCFFYLGFFAVAGAQRAARSGDEKTTGLFQSDASARRVVRVRACSSASVGCFPTALRFNLHLHTEKPTPAFAPTSHMCTQDYINPKENSTTTNKERFVYK